MPATIDVKDAGGSTVTVNTNDAIISAMATAANQATGNASLASILAKIIAAPATEAKQDTLIAKDFATQTTLAAVLAKIIAAPSTEAKQDTIITALGTLAEEATLADILVAAEIIADAVDQANTRIRAAIMGGGVAHDSADSGNPVKVGGRAINAEIAAQSNNDRSDFVTDLVGKQIVMPYTNPENIVSGAITSAMTGTTSTSLVAAPGAGLRNYITTIIVSNAHATVGTDIVIQDGSGGTTLLTIPAAAVYGGAVINLPVPLRQPTANTALFCANVTTGASTKVSAVGYKGA